MMPNDDDKNKTGKYINKHNGIVLRIYIKNRKTYRTIEIETKNKKPFTESVRSSQGCTNQRIITTNVN